MTSSTWLRSRWHVEGHVGRLPVRAGSGLGRGLRELDIGAIYYNTYYYGLYIYHIDNIYRSA